jgi:molybdopterin synthase sulfur carrier subunit
MDSAQSIEGKGFLMVTIVIPLPLRKFTNGATAVEAEGRTVGEVMSKLERDYPGLKGKLRTEEGKVRPFVNMYLNNEDIRFLKNMDTPVGDNDELLIVPALAGGTRT